MAAPALGAALMAALDERTVAELAERLRPHLALSLDGGGLLTAEQAAERLGLHPKTVSRMAREGRLSATKIGGRWRFRADELVIVPPARGPENARSSPSRAHRGAEVPASVRAIRGARSSSGSEAVSPCRP